MDLREENVDVLVIGSGAAGVRAAIELDENGFDVLVIGKCRVGDAHTIMATGGLNAALGNMDPADSWQLHALDTLREGGFLPNQRAVELLAKNAPLAVKELDLWGLPFNKDAKGMILQRFFGAAVYRRACFSADNTGRDMLIALLREAERRKIRFQESVYVTGILASGRKVHGAVGIDFSTGQMVAYHSKAVVLATGGHTSVYKRASTRKFENLGDGMAMAYELGLELMDMEMVQFHPTGMVWPHEAEGLLVTESVRGEGGILLNAKGERFMKMYDPERMELSARDVVARAVYNEIKEGRGTARGAVYMDVSSKPKEYILERLPKMYNQLLHYNKVDISKEKMEIAPTAHYAMGGIVVDNETGKTGIEGLFAVGECTAGVHGANRLGGNSLAETMVFGRLVGKYVSVFAGKVMQKSASANEIDEHVQKVAGMLGRDGREPAEVKSEMRQLMWQHAGVVRTGKELEQGIEKLEGVDFSMKVDKGLRGNMRLVEALDALNMACTSRLILHSALFRKESRGAHYRKDFVKTLDGWRANIICTKGKDGPALKKRMVPALAGELAQVMENAPEYKHRKTGYNPE